VIAIRAALLLFALSDVTVASGKLAHHYLTNDLFRIDKLWMQVAPDTLFHRWLSQGINGNAAVTSGGNENAGNYALGIAADIYSKYRVDLKYTGYYGNYTTNAAGAANVFSGVNSSLSDRGWVSLTFKTTF